MMIGSVLGVRVLVVAVVFAAAAGGADSAVAASGSRALHGCANKKSGALRLASRCRRGERAVSWNVQGRPGANGAQGPPGANGAQGLQGTAGQNGTNAIAGPPTGSAGGALAGSYPNPTLNVTGGPCPNGQALVNLSPLAALSCATGVFSDAHSNVLVGPSPFGALTTGTNNVALGSFMLNNNTTGSDNEAIGTGALAANTTGGDNAAVGVDALSGNQSGTENVAVGRRALENNVSGQFNVGLGIHALQNSTGQNSVGIGNNGGANPTGSGNIEISNAGQVSDSGVIRIGTQGTQTQAFLAGVNGTSITGPAGIALTNSSGQLGTGTTGTVALPSSVDGATSTSGVSLLINSSGVLGTTTSSRRFKTDIQPIRPPTLGGLMALRPVSFHYKARYRVGQPDPLEYGLIAEDVARIDPSLVAYGNDGRPYTVRYQELPVLLLAEVERQQRQIEALRAANRRLRRQREAIRSLQERMTRIERTFSGHGN